MKSPASKRLIGSIQIEAFAHATEDPSKVKQAIRNLAADLEPELQVETLRGHYDNPILLFRSKVEGQGQIERILAVFRDKLGPDNKRILTEELNQHVDERGWLYLRLDKQELFQGRLVFSSGDNVVKVRLSLAPHILRKHKPDEVYRLSGVIE